MLTLGLGGVRVWRDLLYKRHWDGEPAVFKEAEETI